MIKRRMTAKDFKLVRDKYATRTDMLGDGFNIKRDDSYFLGVIENGGGSFSIFTDDGDWRGMILTSIGKSLGATSNELFIDHVLVEPTDLEEKQKILISLFKLLPKGMTTYIPVGEFSAVTQATIESLEMQWAGVNANVFDAKKMPHHRKLYVSYNQENT